MCSPLHDVHLWSVRIGGQSEVVVNTRRIKLSHASETADGVVVDISYRFAESLNLTAIYLTYRTKSTCAQSSWLEHKI